jgi:hypothetical protein
MSYSKVSQVPQRPVINMLHDLIPACDVQKSYLDQYDIELVNIKPLPSK